MTTIKRFTPDYKMHAVRFEAFAREAEHGELVQFDDHQQVVTALEAERDYLADRVNALAVENASRVEIIERLIGIFTASGYHAMQNSHDPCSSLLFDAFQAIRQPATSAAIAAIEARVWAEAKDLTKSMLATDSADHIDFLFDGKIQQLQEAK